MLPAKYSKPFSLLVKIALMLFSFWFVLRGLNISELEAMLRSQKHTFLLEIVLCYFLQVGFGSKRWREVVIALSESGANIISRFRAFKFFYISIFFNCCLPGTVGGDVVRVWLIKSDNIPLPMAISSVVVDRIIALFALGLMGGITLPFMFPYVGNLAWLLVPAFWVSTLLGIWFLFNLENAVAKIKFLSSLHWLTHISQSIRLMMRHLKAIFCSVFYAFIAHGSLFISIYILAESLGSPISLLDTFTLSPWVILISILPFSIGGWGLREAAMVFFLGMVGVSQEAALAISVQLGLLTMLLSLPAGLLWLINRRRIVK